MFNIHYSQIENKVEWEKHAKVRFFPTLGVISNIGGGVSEQCWLYQIVVGLILTVELDLFYLFPVPTKPTSTYFEKFYI